MKKIETQSGDLETWQGTFVLPADAGLQETETFRFIYQGIDFLDNVSSIIKCGNLFQVYQGELPPLSPPENFEGESLANGKIRLSWKEVEAAVGYRLFRQAPGENDLTEFGSLEDNALLSCIFQANFSRNDLFIVTTSLSKRIAPGIDDFAVAYEFDAALPTNTVYSYKMHLVLKSPCVDYKVDNLSPAFRPVSRKSQDIRS